MTQLFSGCNSSNTCRLGDCISEVKGLASNSASPSDTWIWTMKPGIKYQGITIPSVFLKLYITPESWADERRRLYLPTPKEKKDAITGMRYEGEIYMHIIKPLLEYRVSPHFIHPFAQMEGCSFGDLYRLLEGKLPGNILAQLQRNITYMFYQERDRPSISNTISPVPSTLTPDFNNLRFGYILNEAIDSKTTSTLDATLKNMIRSSPFDYLNFFSILFQLAHATYALFLSGTVHNDLHSGNAWVITTHNTPVNVEYTVNGEVFFFEGAVVKAKLYDFDRAYSISLGENVQLDKHLCNAAGQCNEVSAVKDYAKIACYILRAIVKDQSVLADALLSTFVPELLMNRWRSLYLTLADGRHNCFLSLNGKAIPASEFQKLLSYPEILASIYRYYRRAFRKAKGRDIKTSSSSVQRFNMDARMFANGVLIPPARQVPSQQAPIPLAVATSSSSAQSNLAQARHPIQPPVRQVVPVFRRELPLPVPPPMVPLPIAGPFPLARGPILAVNPLPLPQLPGPNGRPNQVIQGQLPLPVQQGPLQRQVPRQMRQRRISPARPVRLPSARVAHPLVQPRAISPSPMEISTSFSRR